MATIGINGFGRIGRTLVRANAGRPGFQVTAINDLTDAATLAHLFKYDSLWGTYPGEVRAEEQSLIIDGQRIAVSAHRNPADIPWQKEGVDIVIESTGYFTDKAKALAHIEAGGAKKVIIAAPAKGDDLTVVMGVNHQLYNPQQHHVISNGSCTTNGLAPVAQVIHQNFAIQHGLMVTTHAYTNSQVLHDQPSSDLRGARSANLSIIPYSTGAAKAIGRVIPELEGRLNGFSFRVPVPVVSIVDLTVTVGRPTTVEEVNAILRQAAETTHQGILGYSAEPLVSSDFKGDPRSSIVDALSTSVAGGTMVKVLAWYDNEWAFSKRLGDLAELVAAKGY